MMRWLGQGASVAMWDATEYALGVLAVPSAQSVLVGWARDDATHTRRPIQVERTGRTEQLGGRQAEKGIFYEIWFVLLIELVIFQSWTIIFETKKNITISFIQFPRTGIGTNYGSLDKNSHSLMEILTFQITVWSKAESVSSSQIWRARYKKEKKTDKQEKVTWMCCDDEWRRRRGLGVCWSGVLFRSSWGPPDIYAVAGIPGGRWIRTRPV